MKGKEILVCLFACLLFGFFVERIYVCFEKYLDKKEATSLQTFSTSSVAFPEVTICPNYLPTPYKLDKICEKYEDCTVLRPRGPHDMLPSFDRLKETNTTFSEYFDDITFNLDELITRFEVITQKSSSLTNARTHEIDIRPSAFSDESINNWQMRFKPENGRCFSYKAPDYLRSAIITTIKVYLNQSQIEIYLHHPGQFCTWSIYSFTAQKRKVYADVSHEIVRDTEDSEELDHCTTDSNMNYDECFYKKYHELFFSKYNCTFSFFVGYRNDTLNQSKTMSSSELQDCKLSDFSEEDAEFLKSFSEDGIFDGDNVKGCYKPCDYMDVSFGYPSIYDITDDDESSLTFYFKTSIPVRESHIAYPRSSLLAEIGGYMGLLLGFSILDFAKVVDLFCHRIEGLGKRVGILEKSDDKQGN